MDKFLKLMTSGNYPNLTLAWYTKDNDPMKGDNAMKQLIEQCRQLFFGRELELRVKIFHVLAIGGVLICIIMTILSLVTGLWLNTVLDICAGLLSFFLLLYSAKRGKYRFCVTVTIIGVFLVLFPILFFNGGGYHSGVPYFFVFAVVYTVYMLDGWATLVLGGLELVLYAGLCVFAYYHPEYVKPVNELNGLRYKMVGFLTVSTALGLTMLAQFRMYQNQQRELEQARSEAEIANQAKSSFLANMSHEIRTPIHVIMSLNELICTQTHDPKLKAYGEKIHSAGEVLRSLVDNILDMSKIEAGKMELEVAPYRTQELMQVLELIGQSRCQSRGLEFRCVKQVLPSVLRGDLAHIQQIAINLLSNAVKYTDTGSVTLSVSCKEGQSPDQVLLRVAVSDTGIGIEQEAIPELFDAFSRAEHSGRRYIEGTGLGLSIVKELCQLMDGSIHVESQKGWGSTFTVVLPQTIAQAKDLPNEKLQSFVAPEGRVLVVDDNPENLSVMQELLYRTQLQVDTAPSGQAAVEAVRKNHYHVVLLDYMMPGMDGVQTLKQLHSIPGFSAPVIALTANAVSGTRSLLLEAGFAEYLTKPTPWGRLEALLMEFLPGELVTVTQLDDDSQRSERFCASYQPLLQPYRIDLRAAMPYFAGDSREYLRTAGIFLDYGVNGQRALGELQEGSADSDLLYLAHSLKGRAKNLGILDLAEEAERVEMLCRSNNCAEAHSMIPHLLFLYRKAIQGLEQLRPEMEALRQTEQQRTQTHDTADCQRQLQEYLDQLQRSPALECIDFLLRAESSEEATRLLHQMRSAVTAIRFDEASSIYVDYLQGGNVWTIEAGS